MRLRGIKVKTMALMGLMTIIPVLVMGVTCNLAAKRIIVEKVDTLSRKNMETLNQQIAWKLDTLSAAARAMTQSEVVLAAMDARPQSSDEYDALQRRLRNQLYLGGQLGRIGVPCSFILGFTGGDTYSSVFYSPYDVARKMRARLEATPWYAKLAGRSYSSAFSGVWDNLMYASGGRQVYFANNILSGGVNRGVALIGVSVSYFEKALAAFRLTKNSRVFMVGGEGDRMIGADGVNLAALPAESGVVTDVGGEDCYVQSSAVRLYGSDRTSWTIYSLTPTRDMYSEVSSLSFITGALVVASCLIIVAMMALMNRWLVRPIMLLNGRMAAVRGGDMTARADASQRDELGELCAGFNAMVEALDESMTRIHRDEEMKRSLEIRVLQAQINPHFVRNTLNTVRWMAELKKAIGISRALTSFIKLINYSFDTCDERVTLREELYYLDEYAYLQRLRYQNRFDYSANVPEELLSARVPRLILQPIVENGVLHGLEEKADAGLLTVAARADGGDLVLEVRDDGVGMDQSRIEAALRGDSPRTDRGSTHIGLNNVRERLRLNYGERYGVAIESEPGCYTLVTLTLPLELDGEGEATNDEGRAD